MKRKLQVNLSEEAWNVLAANVKDANDDFVNGHITYSDIICELLLTAKLDLKSLQIKHTSISRTLKTLSQDREIDIDAAIRTLQELKAKSTKRTTRAQVPLTETSEI